MFLGKARQAGQAEHGKHMVGKVYVMFVCIYTNILGECSFANTRKAHVTQQLAYRTLGHLLSTRRVPLQARAAHRARCHVCVHLHKQRNALYMWNAIAT